MVVIVQSATIVTGSGLAASVSQIQASEAITSNPITQHGSISNSSRLLQFGSISQLNNLLQFGDVSQETKILTPSVASVSVDEQFVLFDKEFTSFTPVIGVIGTSGTVERFFDRSPFFFTPSELDPNTIRDIREAEEFLLFSIATIGSYSSVLSTSRDTKIISDKGDAASRTNASAHVNTSAPVTSGIQFTISGSDGINQIDQTPPFFANLNPDSGTRQVPVSTQVQFSVQDISTSLDQSSIDIFIDGLQVVNAGVATTSTTWPAAIKSIISLNDIQYTFTRDTPFASTAVVTVSGDFADFASPGNAATEIYSFTIVGSGSMTATISGGLDADPPTIIPVLPVDLDTQVSPNTDIVWTTADNSAGVDPNAVTLVLDNVTKLENDQAVTGSFSRVINTSRGFDYTYSPASPFAFGETVTGTIQAADLVGNSDSVTYEFTVTPDDTLRIENFFLDLSQSTLLTSGTIISVEVVDETHGVSSGTTTFTLNGAVPAGVLTTFSGAGPDRVIFTVPVEPLVDFREDLVILVHAENNFPGSTPVIQEQQFTLRPGYDVNWLNKSEDASGGAETVFPYLTNIQVLADVTNFAKNFNTSSAFYRLTTEDQATSDLGATLVSSISTADFSAVIESNNPFFEYGKTIVLEIEADDLEGNQLRLTHTFVIEPKS